MAKIHILAGSPNGIYVAVVHVATPDGNNAAGIAWSEALKGSGRARTIMTEGGGAGQIESNEKMAIEAGAIIEGVTQWQDGAELDSGQKQLSDFDLRANQCAAELLKSMQIELKYFGATK